MKREGVCGEECREGEHMYDGIQINVVIVN